MSPMFTFDGYTVRSMDERDRPYLTQQIAGDPYHFDRMDADSFLKLQPGEDAWALEDEQGKVLFYFKTSTAVRISIQFPGPEGIEDKARNALAMLKGLAWIEGIFRANRFREILFDTQGPELANFAKRRMGFSEAPGLLSRPIEPVPPKMGDRASQEAWEPSPQVSERVG